MEADGETPVCKTLSPKDFKVALREKLVEESTELRDATSRKEIIGEMADVEEILRTLYKTYDIDRKEVIAIRNSKYKKRGGFLKRIFLIAGKR